MLIFDICVGERVAIGDGIVVSLKKKTGQRARIAISADPSLKIQRLPVDLARLHTKSEE